MRWKTVRTKLRALNWSVAMLALDLNKIWFGPSRSTFACWFAVSPEPSTVVMAKLSCVVWFSEVMFMISPTVRSEKIERPTVSATRLRLTSTVAPIAKSPARRGVSSRLPPKAVAAWRSRLR